MKTSKTPTLQQQISALNVGLAMARETKLPTRKIQGFIWLNLGVRVDGRSLASQRRQTA